MLLVHHREENWICNGNESIPGLGKNEGIIQVTLRMLHISASCFYLLAC